MKIVVLFITIASLLNPFTQAFAIPGIAELSELNADEVIEEPIIEPVVEEPKEISIDDKILSSMVTTDLEGYCTIQFPLKYFEQDISNSTGVYKQLNYVDNKSKIYMSYITGMAEGSDIPGYIANELAKVNTFTNDKVTENYNNVEWMKITADKQIDDCNVYIYYTLNKDKSSAFWMKVKVKPEAEDETFNKVLEKMLNSYDLYAPSGTLFDTPTTGYYADNDVDNGTEADTDGHEANNDEDNQVFKFRGGYVEGADISDKWEDMQIILDGNKFQLPCKLYNFTDKGFKVNDSSIKNEDDQKVYAREFKRVQAQNDNGTVVTLIFYNDSATDIDTIVNCDIVGLIVDQEKFLNVTDTAEDDFFNGSESDDENASKNAKDEHNHELILARGITWGVYLDELKDIYNTGKYSKSYYSSSVTTSIFESGTKKMIIRTGNVRDIKYVELNCIEIN